MKVRANYFSKCQNLVAKSEFQISIKIKMFQIFRKKVSQRETHRRGFSLQSSILLKLEPNYFSKKSPREELTG